MPDYEKTLAERGLPHSPDTERSVLGGILLDHEKHWPVAASRLEREDFALESHRRIFQTMNALATANRSIDMVTLVEALQRSKQLDSVGGLSYVISLTEGLPRRISIADYCDVLLEHSGMRSLMLAGQVLMDGGADQADPSIAAEQAIVELQRIAGRGNGRGLVRVEQHFVEQFRDTQGFLSRPAQTLGLKTQFAQYNRLTNGLQRKELIIIAARPSMGKTTLMVNLADELSVNQGLKGAVFSLEQSSQGLLERMVAARADVDVHEMRQSGHMFQGYATRALDEIRRAPLYIDDTSDIGIHKLLAKAELLWQELGGFDYLMVDYLQYIQSRTSRDMNRDQELGQMTKLLRNFARKRNIPAVVLAQLRRESENRGDKHPRLSDLRESGNIEQDADTIAFIHRPGYYEREDESLKDKAELIIAKQRNGPTDTVNLRFHGNRYRFED